MWRKLALLSATQPLAPPVPGESAAAYLADVGQFRAGRRAALRHCTLWWSGQHKLKLDAFPAGARRLLWSYFGETQVGDALMDLASRSLLRDLGLEIDLFAAPGVAALFEGDPWFGRVGSQAGDFAGVDYDCAIVLSNKHRPLRQKMRNFAGLPWVSLHEYFTGPNFHRGQFAARRLADLARSPLAAPDLERHSRQKLGPVGGSPVPSLPAEPTLALVVGGVHRDRSYLHWEPVMRALAAGGWGRFALVGSENGAAQAAALVQALSGQAEISDFTGRLTLAQTRAVLDAASVTAAPDGGLMHLALTTRTRLVSLFSARIAPEWRLPADSLGAALRAATHEVSDIPPEQLVKTLQRFLPAGRP
jgi:hypothetical protein